MAIDSKINIRPMPGQSDFSKIPYDYGKNIVNLPVQRHFQAFLNQKNDTYNKELNDKWFQKAMLLDNIYEKVEILKDGSKAGSVSCAQELGSMYVSGNEVVGKDLEKAKEYLLKAAKSGLPNAMHLLGIVYTNYENLALDALDWVCKSAIKGALPAYKTLNDYSIRYTLRVQIEDRLSVYFREICDKDELTGLENRFLGFCYVCRSLLYSKY